MKHFALATAIFFVRSNFQNVLWQKNANIHLVYFWNGSHTIPLRWGLFFTKIIKPYKCKLGHNYMTTGLGPVRATCKKKIRYACGPVRYINSILCQTLVILWSAKPYACHPAMFSLLVCFDNLNNLLFLTSDLM